MVFKVPNYIVTINNPKGTSKTRYCPKYEVPLLERRFANTAPGGTNPEITCKAIPKQGTKGATDSETGRDRFAGMRITRIASLVDEKKRLRHFYGEDKQKKIHIFDSVYPVDMFEIQAARFYPGIFDAPKDNYEVAVEGEDVDLEPKNTPNTPTDDAFEKVAGPDGSKASFDVVEDDEKVDPDNEPNEEQIEELIRLKNVGPKTAQALINAGFTNIDEIAQTDPLDLATIEGVGEKEANEIVDHAVELSKDSEDINTVLE